MSRPSRWTPTISSIEADDDHHDSARDDLTSSVSPISMYQSLASTCSPSPSSTSCSILLCVPSTISSELSHAPTADGHPGGLSYLVVPDPPILCIPDLPSPARRPLLLSPICILVHAPNPNTAANECPRPRNESVAGPPTGTHIQRSLISHEISQQQSKAITTSQQQQQQ